VEKNVEKSRYLSSADRRKGVIAEGLLAKLGRLDTGKERRKMWSENRRYKGGSSAQQIKTGGSRVRKLKKKGKIRLQGKME